MALLLAASLLAGCSSFAGLVSATPTSGAAATPEATAEPSPTPTVNSNAPVTLTLWLPERFDPTTGELEGTLLQERLEAFSSQYPSVRVDIRLKASTGSGGMLESLLSAQAAAPLALPDLVLLHSSLLPPAVEAGLLRENGPLEDDDWYGFARQMAAWNDVNYVTPFVADGLVNVYRPTAVEAPPATWDESLELQAPLAFAAADPGAPFAISQLLALGASLEGLEAETLHDFYSYIAQAQALSIFPFWLTQFEGQEPAWQAFSEGQSPMVAAWSHRVLADNSNGNQAVPLFTRSGEALTLGQGWSWAVTTALDERTELVGELAAFLSEAEFLSQWSAAAGYLPARPSALAAWSPDERHVLASQLVGNLQMAPSPYTNATLGPVLSEAIVALLKQEITPDEAVSQTLEQLPSP